MNESIGNLLRLYIVILLEKTGFTSFEKTTVEVLYSIFLHHLRSLALVAKETAALSSRQIVNINDVSLAFTLLTPLNSSTSSTGAYFPKYLPAVASSPASSIISSTFASFLANSPTIIFPSIPSVPVPKGIFFFFSH